MIVQKTFIGSDIVVDHDFFVRNPKEHLRHRRSNRKVEDNNIVRRTELFVLSIIVHQLGHPGLEEPDKNL